MDVKQCATVKGYFAQETKKIYDMVSGSNNTKSGFGQTYRPETSSNQLSKDTLASYQFQLQILSEQVKVACGYYGS